MQERLRANTKGAHNVNKAPLQTACKETIDQNVQHNSEQKQNTDKQQQRMQTKLYLGYDGRRGVMFPKYNLLYP